MIKQLRYTLQSQCVPLNCIRISNNHRILLVLIELSLPYYFYIFRVFNVVEQSVEKYMLISETQCIAKICNALYSSLIQCLLLLLLGSVLRIFFHSYLLQQLFVFLFLSLTKQTKLIKTKLIKAELIRANFVKQSIAA